MSVMKNEDNTIIRRRAQESFQSILNFLSKPDALKNFVQIDHKFELNLEKNVPESPYHKNLVLIFAPTMTSGGAKFSLRSDGRFTITIFVPFNNTTDIWMRQFPAIVRDWFLKRRSSYVHEFTHYLDIRDQQLDKVSPPDKSNNVEYYNHPWEIRAFIQQALSDIEHAVEVKLLLKNRKSWVREFGMTEGQFIAKAKKNYFNHEFLRYLSPENMKQVDDSLTDLFRELTVVLREKPVVAEDNVMKRLIDPPKTPNLTLKMAYDDQHNQEEADKDMSKKAIMQYVREAARKIVREELKKIKTKEAGWQDAPLEEPVDHFPEDQPKDQEKAWKASQPNKLVDLFAHLDNVDGGQMREAGTMGADSFQGGAFGFGGKRQLADPIDHMPPEEDDTFTMRLPSSRDREKNGDETLGTGADYTQDDNTLSLYNPNLAEYATDVLDERNESDALYRDIQGMAVDPDANDKNFDPEPPAPEEYGSAHHVGGMGKIVAPKSFVPENVKKAHKRIAEAQHQRARLMKLGIT